LAILDLIPGSAGENDVYSHLFLGCFCLKNLYRLKCSCKCISDFLLLTCQDFYCVDEK